MAETKVRVEGLGRLVSTLRAAEADLDELNAATNLAARIVLSAAQAMAPRVTGRLAGSGKASRARRRASITFGNAGVPYAGPIHWGWPRRNIGAQPFASNAAQATEPVWVAAYVFELQRTADKVRGL
jgi:hypothetical protein